MSDTLYLNYDPKFNKIMWKSRSFNVISEIYQENRTSVLCFILFYDKEPLLF